MSRVVVVRQLLGLLAPRRGRVALAVALGFGTIASSVALMGFSAYLISAAALQPPILDLAVAIVAVRAFGVSRGAFRYLERLVAHDLTFRLLADVRVHVFSRVEPLAPAGLFGTRQGDLLHRVVSDVETLQDFYLRVIAPPAVAVLVLVVALVVFVALLPAAALTLAVGAAVAGLGVPAVALWLGRLTGRWTATARAELAADAVEMLDAAPEFVAFGQQGARLARLADVDAQLIGLLGRAALLSGLTDALQLLAAGLTGVGVLVVAAPAVRAGDLDGRALAALILAALASFEALQPLPGALHQLALTLESGARLFALADASPVVCDPLAPCPAPTRGLLAATGVGFRYRPDGLPALDGVDLRLEPGRRVAVVGPSGAGKTTLTYVLLRFLDATRGCVLLDGHDAREYRQEDVRRMVGLVAQDTHIFNTTLLENLRLARPDAREAEVERALRAARLWDWARSLPERLGTRVGEDGAQMSGGQRQRFALARALLADFPVLVLDEPTAGLDAGTADAVARDLLAAASDRATLVMTHRLAGLEGVDEIVVLDSGRIVERGSHAELLARGGAYARLWSFDR